MFLFRKLTDVLWFRAVILFVFLMISTPVLNISNQSSQIKVIANLRVHEKGRSYDYQVVSVDSVLRVYSRTSVIDVEDYRRVYYEALTLLVAAYYMSE